MSKGDFTNNRSFGALYKLVTLVLAVVFAVLVWIHVDANVWHYTTQLDADIASETILSRVLYDNGFVTPDTWYFSSARRIISAPNIGAFFYPLTGGNMILSMGIGCSIIMGLLLLFMVLYYRQMKFTWLECLVSAVLVLSLSDVRSENQSVLFLWAAYYASHIITIFVISMIYNLSLRKGHVPVALWAVSLVLAMLNSMQGRHASLFCYAPILGCELVRYLCGRMQRKKCGKPWIFLWLVVVNLVAYFGSDFFGSYNTGASRNIRHAGEKFIGDVWPCLKGVVNVQLMPVLVWAVVVCAVVGYVLCFWRLVKTGDVAPGDGDGVAAGDGNRTGADSDQKYYLWSIFSHVASLVLWIMSGTFTTAEVAPRYYIIEIFIVGAGAALFARRFRKNLGVCIGIVTVVLGLMASRYYYDSLIAGDSSFDTDEYKVACWMQENGYDYGYATFEFANSITVYSNDSVKVRAVNSMKELQGCKWLTDSDWYPPVKDAAGATCYLVTEYSEGDFTEWMADNPVDVLEVAEIGKFKVYVLDHDYTVWER